MKFWDSLRISFIFAIRFNFETENTSKSIVQPSFIFPIGCWSSAPSNLFYCFVCSSFLQKSPQKKPFHLQTESRLRCFIPFLQKDRFNFHRFANFGKLKTFFSSNLKLFAFCLNLQVSEGTSLESDKKDCSVFTDLLQLRQFNL